MESHDSELKNFSKMRVFWENLECKSVCIYKSYQKVIKEKYVHSWMWTLDCIDSCWKKRVVCEVLQVLKYPLIVLRVAFVEAGMEFDVRKT